MSRSLEIRSILRFSSFPEVFKLYIFTVRANTEIVKVFPTCFLQPERPKSFRRETKSHECANYRGIGNMQIGFKIREVGGVSDYVRIGGKQSLSRSFDRSLSLSLFLCFDWPLAITNFSEDEDIFARRPNRACYRLLLSFTYVVAKSKAMINWIAL